MAAERASWRGVAYWKSSEGKATKRGDVAKDIRAALRRGGESGKVKWLFGYTIAELRQHLERQFTGRMTWRSFLRGRIHIDHVVPICKFDLSDDAEFRACWALTNLRPLWAKKNMTKGGQRLHLI